MGAYLFRRVLQIGLTLFVFLTIVFFLVNAQPGDISRLYSMDPNLPPETRAQLQELFGVNEPLWKQYLVHLKNTVTGDFGVSFSLYPRTVADVILERLPRTLVLFLTATVVSFYLGFRAGQDHRLASGRLGGIHLDSGRRDAVHGLHALVWPDDDLAVCLQGRLAADREIPGPGGVAGRSRRTPIPSSI